MCPVGRARDRSRGRPSRAASGFSLASLGATELYDAASLLASPVSSWSSSGSGAHAATQATGANQPTWSSASVPLGGQPVVVSTANHWLTAGAAGDFNYLHDGTGATLVLVGRFTTMGATQYLLATSGNSLTARGVSLYCTNADFPRFVTGNGAASPIDLTSNTKALLNTGFVLVVRYATAQATKAEMRLNRAVVASTASEAATPSALASATGLVQGVAFAGFNWIGERGLVVLVNRYLSDAEVAATEALVLARFGV